MSNNRKPYDIALGIPIAGFVGVNGVGKTLLLVQSAIADLATGRQVFSTVQINSKYGASTPIRSLRQLLGIRNATVCLDEVSVIFSSRSSQSLPPEIDTLIQTLRHSGNTVRWSAPAWMRCDNRLRDVTQAVVSVRPFLRRKDPDGSPWPRPLLGMAGVLDTSDGKTDATPTKVLRRKFFVPSRLEAWGAYDTHADTPVIGQHLYAGTCPDCGGSRTRPKHDRARHDALGLPWFDDEGLIPRFSEETPLAVASL